ncbi:hypothetical protein K501DRAFT_338385 [Backusella circina FSU 941]|nr:hypothetical protein K501DRAFT_338385 [Backusella circina FSU 941]
MQPLPPQTKVYRPQFNKEEPQLAESIERQCSISSNGSIDLQGQYVSNDILVALLDRPNEMRDLVTRNNQFYDALRHYITETQGETSWTKFETVLYKSREQLPDRVWMTSISHFLTHNPVFLSKFKETVGWEEGHSRSYLSTAPITSHHYHKQSHGNDSHRCSRRLSNMSLEDVLEQEDDVLYEEAPTIPDGMFSSEHQFYQQPTVRRHSSSYYLVQSEPHPTFVDGTIDESIEKNYNKHF